MISKLHTDKWTSLAMMAGAFFLLFSLSVHADNSRSSASGNASMTVEHVTLTPKEMATVAYDKAQQRAKQGDMNEAIQYLFTVLDNQPTHVAAINQLAALLYGKNRGREAEFVLRKGIKANPDKLSLTLTLAKLLDKSGQPEAALWVLGEAKSKAESDPKHASHLHAMRGALAQELNHIGMARDSYQWLTTHYAEDGRWWLGLAVAEDKSGHIDKAIPAYESALSAGHLSSPSVTFIRERLALLPKPQEVAVDGN